MKRQISSKQTFLLKTIIPGIFIIYCLTVPLLIYFGSDTNHSFAPAIGSFVVFLFITLIIFRVSGKYKVVSIDDNFLYVSNYFKEISISISDIQNVTETRWVRTHPVTINLKADSEFGRKITFMPKIRFFSFRGSHPIVDELKKLANIKNVAEVPR